MCDTTSFLPQDSADGEYPTHLEPLNYAGLACSQKGHSRAHCWHRREEVLPREMGPNLLSLWGQGGGKRGHM